MAKVGDTIRIISMSGEPQYSGCIGTVKYIDDAGQIHGTWGGCAIIPNADTYEVIDNEECNSAAQREGGKKMNFKALLRKHGFTCSSFAQKMGLTRATVNNWANNKVLPRYETLSQASTILGESIETIVAAIQSEGEKV